jgi:hypothetical protein
MESIEPRGADIHKSTSNSQVENIRRRADKLRRLAFFGLVFLVAVACGISLIFVQLQRSAHEIKIDARGRQPYDYKILESSHENIAVRLKEISLSLADSRQELISDRYGATGRGVAVVARELQERSGEIAVFRSELEDRIGKDRQRILAEVEQLKSERDRAIADGIERTSFIRLVGDAVMRVGVLILAIYVISILSSVVKYWLRVADHLHSVADSIEMCIGFDLPVEHSIRALTPHSIDFQVEDIGPFKSAKEMVNELGPIVGKSVRN